MMDFMKAYDRIDRETMVETLRAMNFGEKCIKMVEVLYAESSASVVLNGEMGEEFRTRGGVRQGCPLSPYLFIVVLELMAIALRESEQMYGIRMKQDEGSEGAKDDEDAKNDKDEQDDAKDAVDGDQGLQQDEAKDAVGAASGQPQDEARDAVDAASGQPQEPQQAANSSSKNRKAAHATCHSISSYSQKEKQKDSIDDRISMFADDSSTLTAKTEQIRVARNIIGDFERASGSKLHDGKTMILKLGKTRRKALTKKQLGVEFTIMEDDATEDYLGDVIGNEVKEGDRFDEKLEKMKKLGERWNRENIGVYGRSIVANTLLLSKLKHRADVNALSQAMKKKILGAFKAFMWKGEGKKARLRWEVMVQPIEEGGSGVKDPICALDASKMRILIRLMTRNRQPWMKWVERKLIRVAKKWGIEEAMAAKTTKKQRNQLREDCLVESTLKIWLEIGGRRSTEEEARKRREKEKEARRKKEEELDLLLYRLSSGEERDGGDGVRGADREGLGAD